MAAQHQSLMYGTAWKKEETTKLVLQALKSGFRAIDVAAQPRHYREDLVGEALRQAYYEGVVRREDVFIQTKFTSIAGQDPDNLPYDPNSPLETQVQASIKSSLTNLRPNTPETSTSSSYINSLILHSPLPTLASTLSVWKTLSTYVPTTIQKLGIANTSLSTLQALYTDPSITVKPSYVQNRFYEDTDYDVDVRRFCREKGIVYQSFWTLTANPKLMRSEVVGMVSERVGVERAVGLYGLVLGLGGKGEMVVLDGTKKEERMVGDLKGVEMVERWGEENPGEWSEIMMQFTRLIGEAA